MVDSVAHSCGETYPAYVGVTSTPVIDAATGIVYVEAFNSTTSEQELHALNLHDPNLHDNKIRILPPQFHLPDDSANALLWSKSHRNRPGLLLSNGVVYVAFSSFICDTPRPYGGRVLGYRANDLKQVAVWHTLDAPGGSSGIWQSGRGLAASDDGDVYLMTGNDNTIDELDEHGIDSGDFSDLHFANSFSKLTPSTEPNGFKKEIGIFTPNNTRQLSVGATDLGSSGPILLPGNRLVGGGKQQGCSVLNEWRGV